MCNTKQMTLMATMFPCPCPSIVLSSQWLWITYSLLRSRDDCQTPERLLCRNICDVPRGKYYREISIGPDGNTSRQPLHPGAVDEVWGQVVWYSRTQSGGVPLQVRLGRQVLVVDP